MSLRIQSSSRLVTSHLWIFVLALIHFPSTIMEGLVQRLRKYLPTTSSITGGKMVATIELPRETAGVLLWNLVVKYILDYSDTISNGGRAAPCDEEERIQQLSKLRLYIVAEEFIIANDSYNRQEPCMGLTKKLLAMITSIVRSTLVYSEFLVKSPRSVKVLAEVVSGISEMVKTAQAEMESELFIESMLVPMAAALVADTRTASERLLGFKIWDFVSQYSVSAGENHGIYFGPIMLNFCKAYNDLGSNAKREETPEQIADFHKIFDQILSCTQTHAFTERSNSFINTSRPNARYTSYLHAFDRETFDRSYLGFGSPYPLIYKKMMTAFSVNRYQRRGDLDRIIQILSVMKTIVIGSRRVLLCTINRDMFERLLDGIFSTTLAVLLEDHELGIHEKSQLIGAVMSVLAPVCSEYTEFIMDEETELSLLQKLRKLDSLARIHCCPSCYPGTDTYRIYYFLKHVLHQEDTPPFQFYRPPVGNVYKIRIQNDPYYDACILQQPETCSSLGIKRWMGAKAKHVT